MSDTPICPGCGKGDMLRHYPGAGTSQPYACHTSKGPLKTVMVGDKPQIVFGPPVELGEGARYWCDRCSCWLSTFNPVPDEHPSIGGCRDWYADH